MFAIDAKRSDCLTHRKQQFVRGLMSYAWKDVWNAEDKNIGDH